MITNKLVLDLYKIGVFKFGSFLMVSGLRSPYYIDLRVLVSYPKVLEAVVDLTVKKLKEDKIAFDLIAGIPYTALPIANLMAQKLNKPMVYFRKEVKDYGTGRRLEGNYQKNDRALLVDDLVTTAKSKIEAAEILDAVSLKVKDILVFVDREQGGKEFLESKGFHCHSVLGVSEIFEILFKEGRISRKMQEECLSYTQLTNIRGKQKNLQKPLIKSNKSVIIACDVPSLELFEKLVKDTGDIEGIGGYKIGLELAIRYGLPLVVKTAKKYTSLPLIYDHQKGGSDIPDMGGKFAVALGEAGVEAAILFPFGGIETEKAWIRSCFEQGLHVLVGAHMTQQGFLKEEGGFIDRESIQKMFRIALDLGVKDFVVPGNQPEAVLKYKIMFDEALGKDNFCLYAPGFITQGGEVSEMGKVAGNRWHAIVGSAIYRNENLSMRQAARLIVKGLKKNNER